MARAYDPGGHIRLIMSDFGTLEYGPNPGGDLEIFDSSLPGGLELPGPLKHITENLTYLEQKKVVPYSQSYVYSSFGRKWL